VALYAKLALRNVFRNRRRTLITLAAMGFGAAAIIVFGGFVHSIYYGVRESTIRSQVGHIHIYRKGYSEKGNLAPFDYLIADYPTLREELRRIEHVKMVTARLGFSGLVSTGDTTTAFVGAGVVPECEMDLSALAVIVDGKELASRDPRGVTLGIGRHTDDDIAGARPGLEFGFGGRSEHAALTLRMAIAHAPRKFLRLVRCAIPQPKLAGLEPRGHRLGELPGADQQGGAAARGTEQPAHLRAVGSAAEFGQVGGADFLGVLEQRLHQGAELTREQAGRGAQIPPRFLDLAEHFGLARHAAFQPAREAQQERVGVGPAHGPGGRCRRQKLGERLRRVRVAPGRHDHGTLAGVDHPGLAAGAEPGQIGRRQLDGTPVEVQHLQFGQFHAPQANFGRERQCHRGVTGYMRMPPISVS